MDETWDAIVIGAGPAGSVSAALLAERGWRVLLVEKQKWPRQKACGGCLNAAGMRMLRAVGLGSVLNGAAELRRFDVHVGKRQMEIAMPPGCVVERATFDARLVDQAQRRGAAFMPECSARVLPDVDAKFRRVRIESTELRARVVIACDGLRGNSLAGETWAKWDVERGARIGVAATVAGTWANTSIAMFIGSDGYVGVVAQNNGRVHLGAAVDPAACNRRGGPLRVMENILRECGQTFADLDQAEFEATGPLTAKRRRAGGYRVLAVGDSCGYVEPFTGEGMAWAISGAIAAVKLLPRRAEHWPVDLASQWQAAHERQVARRQVWCRWLREIVKRPRIAAACLNLARQVPWAPAMIARRIGA